MKYTINQITQGEDELILNYREVTEEVERILAFMGRENRRLLGWKENEQVVIAPGELLYMESVEGKTFGYTAREVYRLNYTLQQLEILLQGECFFRCSKSMIMNINKAYPISLIIDDDVANNNIRKVNTYFGTCDKYFLENVSIKPDASATAIPIIDISKNPNGVNLKKFSNALLKMNFSPLKLKRFSTAINVGSSSFVLTLTVLYVACISNADNIPLNITTTIVKKINIVIG